MASAWTVRVVLRFRYTGWCISRLTALHATGPTLPLRFASQPCSRPFSVSDRSATIRALPLAMPFDCSSNPNDGLRPPTPIGGPTRERRGQHERQYAGPAALRETHGCGCLTRTTG